MCGHSGRMQRIERDLAVATDHGGGVAACTSYNAEIICYQSRIFDWPEPKLDWNYLGMAYPSIVLSFPSNHIRSTGEQWPEGKGGDILTKLWFKSWNLITASR